MIWGISSNHNNTSKPSKPNISESDKKDNGNDIDNSGSSNGNAPNGTGTNNGTSNPKPSERPSEPSEPVDDMITLHFIYSDSNIEGFDKKISKNVELNPNDYIKDNAGYAFIGFDAYDWSNPHDGDNITINVKPVSTGKAILAYLNSDYTSYLTQEYDLNQNVSLLTTSKTINGQTFVRWNLEDTNITKSVYTLPIYAVNDDEALAYSLSNNNNKTTLNLDLVDGEYQYYLNLVGDSTNEAISQNETEINLQSGVEYKLEGFVTYKGNDGKLHAILASDEAFDADTANIGTLSESEASPIYYQNGFIVPTSTFKSKAPKDYELDTIAIVKDGEIVEERSCANQDTVGFKVEAPFRVDAYYKKVATTSIMSYKAAKRQPTPGYRIHMVGYYVETLPSKGENLYGVTLAYQGTNLYTKYYASGKIGPVYYGYNSIYTFALPIKYVGYAVAGSKDYKDIITQDETWDVELYATSPTINGNNAQHKIIYMDHSRSKILDIEYVLDGANSVGSQATDTYDIETQNSRFVSKPVVPSQNVKCDFIYNLQYDMRPLKDLNVIIDLKLITSPNKLKAFNELNSNSDKNGLVDDRKYYVTGGTEYPTRTKFDYGTVIDIPVTSGLTYTVEFEYTVKNASGDDVKTSTQTVTIPTSLNSGNVAAAGSKLTTEDIQFNANANSISYITNKNKRIIGFEASYQTSNGVVTRGTDFVRNHANTFTLFSSREIVSQIYVPENTTVSLVYYMENQTTGIFEGFDGYQITTGSMNASKFQNIFSSNCTVTYDPNYYKYEFSNKIDTIDTTFLYQYCKFIGKGYSEELMRDFIMIPDAWYNDYKGNHNFGMCIIEANNGGEYYDTINTQFAVCYVTQGLVHIEVYDFDETSVTFNTEYILDPYVDDASSVPSWILDNWIL